MLLSFSFTDGETEAGRGDVFIKIGNGLCYLWDRTTHLSPLRVLCFSQINFSVPCTCHHLSPTASNLLPQNFCPSCSHYVERGAAASSTFSSLLECHFLKEASSEHQTGAPLSHCPVLSSGQPFSQTEIIFFIGLLSLSSVWNRGWPTLGHGPNLACGLRMTSAFLNHWEEKNERVMCHDT